MRVAVVDSGGANLASVCNALGRLGARPVLTRDAGAIRTADRVILPGVGAAAWAMQALRQAGLVEVLQGLQRPLLGICLGLQLLFEGSEEGEVDCLGLLPGRVRPLAGGPGLRLPHTGWNQVCWRDRDDPLARGIEDGPWFYFVHGFAAPAAGAVAVSDHGRDFAAVVRRGRLAACQFHPERSAAAGRRLLRNFLSEEAECA